jgi:hypothetical protein
MCACTDAVRLLKELSESTFELCTALLAKDTNVTAAPLIECIIHFICSTALSQETHSNNNNHTELLLAFLWQLCLKRDQVGADDSGHVLILRRHF